MLVDEGGVAAGGGFFAGEDPRQRPCNTTEHSAVPTTGLLGGGGLHGSDDDGDDGAGWVLEPVLVELPDEPDVVLDAPSVTPCCVTSLEMVGHSPLVLAAWLHSSATAAVAPSAPAISTSDATARILPNTRGLPTTG